MINDLKKIRQFGIDAKQYPDDKVKELIKKHHFNLDVVVNQLI